MIQFVVNHSHKYVYRLVSCMETFDEVMDKNLFWDTSDDIDYYEEEVEPIEALLKLMYASNLCVYEFTKYIRSPEVLVWYMNSQDFSLYDITRAVNVWEGKPELKIAMDVIDDLIAYKNEIEYMSGEKDATGYADEDEMMLCDTMNRAM